jgi:hypothetical protein
MSAFGGKADGSKATGPEKPLPPSTKYSGAYGPGIPVGATLLDWRR